MEDEVARAFDLQLRQGLLKGVNLTHEQIPMFDFQDERELENKKEKIAQYYRNWLEKGSESEIAKAYDSLVKQHADLLELRKDDADFEHKIRVENLTLKSKLHEINRQTFHAGCGGNPNCHNCKIQKIISGDGKIE